MNVILKLAVGNECGEMTHSFCFYQVSLRFHWGVYLLMKSHVDGRIGKLDSQYLYFEFL